MSPQKSVEPEGAGGGEDERDDLGVRHRDAADVESAGREEVREGPEGGAVLQPQQALDPEEQTDRGDDDDGLRNVAEAPGEPLQRPSDDHAENQERDPGGDRPGDVMGDVQAVEQVGRPGGQGAMAEVEDA